ncbi:MAG TPA: Minf_1886 family protein [Verrucomicrobiae bacterium]|nr:Minf_1886 family protein [Verrucomicrobiae bacterium]
MQDVSFEEALEIITIKDPRYPRDAYLFVREALDHTQRTLIRDKQGSIRHVSGHELLEGIKSYAASQFGPMAVMVFESWGIHSCQDFGELVFNMVETGGCPSLCSDDIPDVASLGKRLQQPSHLLSAYIWKNLSVTTRQLLESSPASLEARELLTNDLNRIIHAGPLYDPQRFASVPLSDETRMLVGRQLSGVPLAQLNRLLLECAYPGDIPKSHGLLAKTKNDSRADFEDGFDFYEAFCRPYLPPSKQASARSDPVGKR